MQVGQRPRLERAYLDTTYRVFYGAHAAPIDVRVGRRCPALDRLLHRHGVRDWAFITAWNPASRPLPLWRNRAREAGLRHALRGARVRWPGLGIPTRAGWEAERSLLVAPLSPGRARRLARQFRQNAVVIGRRGRAPVLLWCARAPQAHLLSYSPLHAWRHSQRAG